MYHLIEALREVGIGKRKEGYKEIPTVLQGPEGWVWDTDPALCARGKVEVAAPGSLGQKQMCCPFVFCNPLIELMRTSVMTFLVEPIHVLSPKQTIRLVSTHHPILEA